MTVPETNGRLDHEPPAPQAEPLEARLGRLLARLEALEDAAACATAEELVSTLMEMYGDGLERIFEALEAPEATAQAVRDGLLDDGVVASLLLIHGLYPVELETRVKDALEELRPHLEQQSGAVELVSLVDGVATLRLSGDGCNGCGGSVSALETIVTEALSQMVPDLSAIDVQVHAQGSKRASTAARTPLPVQSRG
ncbi:MAG: NifU family protein [Actinomycetota bacterium]